MSFCSTEERAGAGRTKTIFVMPAMREFRTGSSRWSILSCPSLGPAVVVGAQSDKQ